ncbi:DUF3710 domain-containing protein [Nocardioides caldifontis]|uniref:DUF3710 domain-containing protein n=1 Tax=Nocardioides caldifontis TaxID=2588938 RepID=UPI0011DFEFEA|nr:DUF3710 domain-containing protein [Nocardioides caldifontis]
MRLRRKQAADSAEPAEAVEEAAAPTAPGHRSDGPWDSSELTVEEDDETRADLGALSIEGHPEVELRLQVDEASQQVQAVMLVAQDGAMELRAFASARNEELWDELRPRLVEEASRHGGSAEEVEGPYGPALQLTMPVVDSEGRRGTQQSVVMGIAGPRWMLRVTMFGRPAAAYDPEGLLERTLRKVVVTRGSEPMAPGDPLPLKLPSGARRMG